MVLESDLLHSSIIGCTNPILSGGPCTMVATILPNARGLKKFNDDYPIIQDLVFSGVMSDKGFPIIKARFKKFSGFVIEFKINLLRNVV
ncbi:hypothetical protein [Helicobacter bilis]|uniref:hypothetical protein n=1 Tax=Helicobacter bilis TaxID=37372 RepID=UPI000A418F52|nr:hypothetical protein [Helicobacter bilis]